MARISLPLSLMILGLMLRPCLAPPSKISTVLLRSAILQSLKKSGPFFPMLTRWVVSSGSTRRSMRCAGTVWQRVRLSAILSALTARWLLKKLAD